MNRFAEIKYGRVHDIVETLNDMDWIKTIFSPTALFVDVTGINDTEGNPVSIGCTYDAGEFKPPLDKTADSLEDHKKLALERKTALVNQKIEGGFYSDALGKKLFFASSKSDQENMEDMQALIDEGSEDVDLYVTAKPTEEADELTREIYTITPEQLAKLWSDFKTHRIQCRRRGSEIDKAIRNSKFIEEVYNFLNWER